METMEITLTVEPVTDRPKGNTRWGKALKRWEGSTVISAQPITYEWDESTYARNGVRVVFGQDVRQAVEEYQDLRFSFPSLRQYGEEDSILAPTVIITDEYGEIIRVSGCLRTVTENGVTERHVKNVRARGDVGRALDSWNRGVSYYHVILNEIINLKDMKVRDEERLRKVAEVEATPIDEYTERAIQRVKAWLDKERPCPKTDLNNHHSPFIYSDVRTFACDVMVQGMAEHFVAVAGKVKADKPLSHRLTDKSDPFVRISIAEAYAECVNTFVTQVHNENLALAGEAIKRFSDLARAWW
jgi:hypothetical protein